MTLPSRAAGGYRLALPSEIIGGNGEVESGS